MPDTPKRRSLSIDDYVEGVIGGDRAILARAITLIESTAPRHQAMARDVLTRLMPYTGRAHRIGITGVPGVGKSTFIEALGKRLTGEGKRLAVLAVDPSSSRSGGSILGDKTRMTELAVDDNAFIRPSPTGGTLGGVAAHTYETMLLCEAAGHDVVFIETVGVGQSEIVVADIADFFLVLMLSGAGDELQGIKRGLMEIADMLCVNKADGDNLTQAKAAAATYRSAMRLLHPRDAAWVPPVVTASALEGIGLEEVWDKVVEHRELMTGLGEFAKRRRLQQSRWLWRMIDERLRLALTAHPDVQSALPRLEAAVEEGTLPPTTAADAILRLFLGEREG